MATPAIIRRFRKELRARKDIQPGTTVTLSDESKRSVNTQAAIALLHEAFHGRIHVLTAQKGIVCGSREEAAIQRLQEYTRQNSVSKAILLAEIPVEDLKEYLAQKNMSTEVYVPHSPEKEFVDTLAKDFTDIIYGL